MLFLKYFACLAICLIVVSPMLTERNEQYGNPLFFSQNQRVFIGESVTLVADNMVDVDYSAFDYIDDHGFEKFIEKLRNENRLVDDDTTCIILRISSRNS